MKRIRKILRKYWSLIIGVSLISCYTIIPHSETEYYYWNEECIHLDKAMIWYDEETMRCDICNGYVPLKNRKR
jgi:hypothetical protein